MKTPCTEPLAIHEATAESIQAFVQSRKMKVLTFAGYSGAGYENPAVLLKQAARILARHDPSRTIVNIGATADGIGAVYALAKAKGFTTMGIVSTLAREERIHLSPCVDHVFFVNDSTWGGQLPCKAGLSPTSAAIVANSAALIAIGGGDIARDEMRAMREAGKPVEFIAADMDHQIAREKARKQGLARPDDFRGSAHEALGQEAPSVQRTAPGD